MLLGIISYQFLSKEVPPWLSGDVQIVVYMVFLRILTQTYEYLQHHQETCEK